MTVELRDTLDAEYEAQIPALLAALRAQSLPAIGLGSGRLAEVVSEAAGYRRPRAPLAARFRSKLRRLRSGRD